MGFIIEGLNLDPTFAAVGRMDLTDDLVADSAESYLQDGIQVTGDIQVPLTWPINSWDVEEIQAATAYDGLCCLYLHKDAADCYSLMGTDAGMTPNIFATFKGTDSNTDPWSGNQFPFTYWNPAMVDPMVVEFATNIPIFDDMQYVSSYLTEIDPLVRAELIKEYAINCIEEDTFVDFEILNPWQHGTWTSRGPSPDSAVAYRNVRGKISLGGKCCLYRIGLDDGSLKMGFKAGGSVFDALEYSTDGVTYIDTNTFPFTWFYAERIDELGTFNYALAFGNGLLPIWDNEDDADDYIDGTKPIEDAPNYPIISGERDPKNPTGDPSIETIFGEVGAQSIFSQQYIVPTGVLYEIANTFYDTTTAGLWDDIKKGLKMYGENSPIEVIENLTYYPLDLSTVFTNVSSQNHIYFGGYQMNLTQGSVDKIINPNGSKDMGSVPIQRTWHNWMDFEPYCKLYVNLPYCGEYQLNLSEYYDKYLSVKYFIDTRTGSCCACLLADGHLVDKFNGQMGVQMPIKLTDFSAYANSQIQTLLGMGGQAVQSGTNLAGAIGQGTQAGLSAGAVAFGAAGLAGVAGAALGARTAYGLTQNNINNFAKTKGGSTSMLNMYMPQQITFTFEINQPDVPNNFYQLNGYPSNKTGAVGSFSGYLKCDNVKLKLSGATDAEYEKARALLLGGIYL